MDGLTARIGAFKDRMMNLAKGKHAGYDTLEAGQNLNQPLVESGYDDKVTPLGGEAASYRPPGTEDQQPAAPYYGGYINDPSYQLREQALLAKEAAAILWEMIALGESGAAKDEMVQQAKQLQAELRGAISDAGDVEPTAMTEALDSFDMLGRCLAELGLGPPVDAGSGAATSEGAPAAGNTVPVLAPPPHAPGGAAAEEKPLIEL